LLTAISGIFPSRILASVGDILSEERVLSFHNLHTKEVVQTVYFRNGEYIPESLAEINHIFRDHYNGSVKPIDLNLIDLLYGIRKNLNSTEPFHVISGYRTKKTNSYLRNITNGVAKNSLHMKGKAVDIRMPGFQLRDLRRAAYELKAGGVGYYPKSNFVHVDVGRVRYW
jgi:uncharacterized protein YcbK (DUF882 family)